MRETVLPSGTVTFLLTDIEGSTKLWQRHDLVMGRVVERHDKLIASAVADHGGVFVKSKGEGDSTFSVFAKPSDAVAAALAVQQAITLSRGRKGSICARVRVCTRERPSCATATTTARR